MTDKERAALQELEKWYVGIDTNHFTSRTTHQEEEEKPTNTTNGLENYEEETQDERIIGQSAVQRPPCKLEPLTRPPSPHKNLPSNERPAKAAPKYHEDKSPTCPPSVPKPESMARPPTNLPSNEKPEKAAPEEEASNTHLSAPQPTKKPALQ